MYITTRPYSICFISLDSLGESNKICSLLEIVKNENPDEVFEFRQADLEFSFESCDFGTGIKPKKNPYVFEVHGFGGYTDIGFAKRVEELLHSYDHCAVAVRSHDCD